MPTTLIQPVQRDQGLLGDVRRARAEADRLHLWWLGQSGFLLQWQERHLLFDPYLSDSLTDKYERTDKPHVRMTARAVEPDQLDFVDVVTSSHNHTDHLDPDTLGPLLRVNPKIILVIPEANRDFVSKRLGVPGELPRGLDAGQSLEAAGFRLHAIPAAHNELEKDEAGRHRFLGYVVQAGPWTVYHSGDTLLYPGMVETLRRWRVDVALLPINGNLPERRVAGNLDGPEAATLAKEMGAGVVIPCHYEMFEFNTATPEAFIRRATALGQPHQVLRCGEHWRSSRSNVAEPGRPMSAAGRELVEKTP
jgi:L-ascorbate metabolism protein UlaG (beta-lactamase superfamily)